MDWAIFIVHFLKHMHLMRFPYGSEKNNLLFFGGGSKYKNDVLPVKMIDDWQWSLNNMTHQTWLIRITQTCANFIFINDIWE